MALYRNTTTGEIRDLDDALIAAWQAAGNPKAAQWEAYTPPPPPPPPPPPGPAPDWDQFREGLRTENGYQTYFAQAAQQRLLTAASLPVEFSEFRKTGNYSSFLSLFVDLVSRLSPQDAANALRELIELSQRCNMPQPFIDELLQLSQPPAS